MEHLATHYKQFIRHNDMTWIASLPLKYRSRAKIIVGLFDDNDAQPTPVVYKWLAEQNIDLDILRDIALNVSNQPGGHFYEHEDEEISLNQLGQTSIIREMDDEDYFTNNIAFAEETLKNQFPKRTPSEVIHWLAKIEWYDIDSEQHMEHLRKASGSNN